MNILFYITAFLFSLGQLGRVSFFGQQVNFYLYEVVLTFSLFFLLFKYRFEPVNQFWKNYKPVFLFFSVLIISLLVGLNNYSLFENIVGFLYLLESGTLVLLFNTKDLTSALEMP